MKCKEKDTNFIFDATLWEDDAILIRQSGPEQSTLYIISPDVFAERFAPIGD